MTRRIPDKIRTSILELLDKDPPTPYREIQKTLKVSSGVIAQVKREANRPVTKRAPPSTPRAPSAGTEGDGMAEFVPPKSEPKAAPKEEPAIIQACPHCGARWQLDRGEAAWSSCPKCKRNLEAARVDDEQVYGCGRCGQQWTLDPGEQQVVACPKCGVKLRAS